MTGAQSLRERGCTRTTAELHATRRHRSTTGVESTWRERPHRMVGPLRRRDPGGHSSGRGQRALWRSPDGLRERPESCVL